MAASCSGSPEAAHPSLMMGVSLSCKPRDYSRHWSADPMLFVRRLARLCKRYSWLGVHINCFDGSLPKQAAKQLERARCRAVSTSRVPGMKGLFWKRAVALRQTTSDYIWLVDADMHVDGGNFSLSRMVDAMVASRASLAQPRIVALPGRRSSDYELLRASTPFPPSCRAVEVGYVEVQAPIFRRDAFDAVHRHLLSAIPDELLALTVWGIPGTWCRLLQEHSGGSARPACALLEQKLVHFDKHLIEIVAGGRVGSGEKWWKFRKRINQDNGSFVLPRYLRQRFPSQYVESRVHKQSKHGACRAPCDSAGNNPAGNSLVGSLRPASNRSTAAMRSASYGVRHVRRGEGGSGSVRGGVPGAVHHARGSVALPPAAAKNCSTPLAARRRGSGCLRNMSAAGWGSGRAHRIRRHAAASA